MSRIQRIMTYFGGAFLSISLYGPLGANPAETDMLETEDVDFVTWSADVRSRYEHRQDGKDPVIAGAEKPAARTVHRLRARLGLEAQAKEDLKFHLKFSTGGQSATDNQTPATGYFTRKEFNLALSYMEWTFFPGVDLWLGKMSFPFERVGGSSIIFDGDVNPEGAYLGLTTDLGFVNLKSKIGAFNLEERADSVKDAGLVAIQFTAEFKTNDYKIAVGVGAYDYQNLKGEPLNVAAVAGGKGNTLSPDGTLTYDYHLTNYYAEVTRKIGNMPISIFADFVINNSPRTERSGSLLGLAVGGGNEQDPWKAEVTHRELQKDAALAALSDAVPGGGGTGISGDVLSVKYVLPTGPELTVNLIQSKRDVFDTNNEKHGKSVSIFQFDLTAKI